MTDEERSKKLLEVKKALKQLMPYFDNVQIFCSNYDPIDGDTSCWSIGSGNLFARAGQVQQWLSEDNTPEGEC